MVSCKWKCLDCGNTFKTETDVVRVFGEECPRCKGINLDLISVRSKKDNRIHESCTQSCRIGVDYAKHSAAK
jgi:Zn finger protein HypA/HybF involved in hydrogenase expression